MIETPAVLMVNAAAATFMVGLIWFVQVVHYPLFARVGDEALAAYEADHVARTGRVVGPVMLLELFAATWCVLLPLDRNAGVLAVAGLALLLVVWGSTFVWQVPCHWRLREGADAATIRRLVRTNWVRTIAWTLRGGAAWWLVAVAT